MLTLVIGGARSGKSRLAESLCLGSRKVAYIATARANDEEMQARIARHRHDRPAHWETFEEPLAIVPLLRKLRQEYDVLLMDCLTVWLSNSLFHNRRQSSDEIENQIIAQLDAIVSAASGIHLIVVTNEVGGGIVPTTKVGRIFRDLHGRANQRIAAAADRVLMTIAGIPIQLKPLESGIPVLPEKSK
jgi:adenosylcobinamide kinase / adenosylcobinamide-phosphate guanylyltransferase